MIAIKSNFLRTLLLSAFFATVGAYAQNPAVTVSVTNSQINGTGAAVIALNATGVESNVTFTLSWDPAVLQYVSDAKGTAVVSYTANKNSTASGKLSVQAAVTPGETYAAGTHTLVTVNFAAVAATGSTNIAFIDGNTLSPPLARKRVFDALGTNITSATFTDVTIVTTLPPVAPAITAQPANQTVNPGATATFTVTATGNPAPSFQWQKSTDGTNWSDLVNGGRISGATSASLQISGAAGADVASYRVRADNSQGSATSTPAATLSLNPGIAPDGFTPTSGSGGTTVTINGAGFTGATAVRFNGLDAASFNVVSPYQITAVVPTFATTGPISVTPATGSPLVATPAFTVTEGPRLISMTQRAAALGNENALLASFSIEGSAGKKVLVRAVSSTLTGTGLLADPFLSIYDANGVQVISNNDWGGNTTLSDAFTAVGASALATNSKDSAALAVLNPGTYTARVTGVGGTTGVAVLEVYEVDAPQRLAYVSNRAAIAAGATTTTTFVLGGATGNQTVLIRALGVGGGATTAVAHPNPTLVVKTVGGATVAGGTNDNFNATDTALAAATAAVGAMPLRTNDAAVLLNLPAGVYVVETSASSTAATATGAVLTEVHLVDSFRPASIPPALIAPLHQQAVNIGGTVIFAAPFVGKPAPAIQWQKAPSLTGTFADIAGQTGSTFTLNVASESDFAAYRVKLQSDAGTVTSGAALVDVIKTPQSISFPTIQAPTFGQTVPLTAQATSNLPVVYATSDANIATITDGAAGKVLNFVGVGSVTITASQPGNGIFEAAADFPQTLTVAKANATITVTGLSHTFNGSAKTVTVTTSPADLNFAVTYNGSASHPSQAGSYEVVVTITHAHYQGSKTETMVIAKADQTIIFGALPTKTFGDGPFTITATTNSPHPVQFASSDQSVASVSATTLEGGVSSATITITGGGSATITASEAGGVNFNAAQSVPQTLTVNRASQTISFGALANKVFLDAPFTVSASASSALAVQFSIASGPANITNGNTVNITGAGTVVVRASQPGNANYAAAPDVDQSFTVAKADQTIAFTGLSSFALDQSPVTLTAVAQPSGLPVTFATSNPSTGTVATVSGNTLTLANIGTIDVTASQGGSDNFNPAPAVTRSFTITAQSQTLTFAQTQLPTKTFGDAPFTISASSNRVSAGTPYTVVFTSSNTDVATVTTGVATVTGQTTTTTATVTIVGAGTATITASQPGDSNTGAATPVARTLTVEKAAATVTLTPASLAQIYNGQPRAVTATTNPTGLNVVFTYGAAPGSSVAPTNAGTHPVTATIHENNYAGTASGSLVIAKADQEITFPSFGSPKLINAGTFTLAATSDSNLAVTYTSSNAAVASVTGNTVTIHALGTTTITAKQAGNDNYNAATDKTQSLTVNPVAPQIVSAPSGTQTAIRGSFFLYGPITLNALSAPVTFTATGLPAGLSVNAASGNISGTPTEEGTFTITLTVTNATSSDSRTINLTVQPPAPVITSPAAASAVAGTAFTYTPTATPATGVTFTTGTLPSWLSFNGTTLTGTATESGSVTVLITATNATGAVTLPLVINVTLPANAPVYSGTLNPSGTAGVAFTFTPNFGTGTTTFAMTQGTLPTGITFNSATGALSGTTQQVGVFPITITATRVGLTATANLNLTINPAATAPVVGFPAPGNARTATVGTAITAIQLTATPAATNFSATGLPPGITMTSAGLVSGTPTTQGTYNALITASNTAGTGSAATLLFTVNPGANAPVITSAPVVQGRVGQSLTYTLSASPAEATTYGRTGALPPGVNFDGAAGTVTGTPTAAGTFVSFFAGTNANPTGGTGEALEVTFTIAPPLTVPVVNSNGTAAGQVGQSFSYIITATNNPTSFSATGLPSGLTLTNATTGLISGVPTTATGATPVTVTLTATNGDGTSNPKSLLISIASAPATPVVTSASTASGRVGQTFTYQITATQSPTSYVANGLPAGLSVNPTNGAITGTPSVSGSFTASIAAANAGGVGASAPLNFTIAAAATAPAISSAASVTGQVGTAFTYQITTTGGVATSYAVTGTLPAGLALNSTTGRITGSPTAPGTFTVSLTATGEGGTSLPQPLSLSINPAAGVPVITSPTSAAATAGASFDYIITATNMPAPPFPPGTSLDAVNLPAGLAVNPATGHVQGVPSASGAYTASLVGTNASGTGPIRDLVINVQAPLAAPVVTNGAVATAQVGANFNYTVTATNNPTSFEVLGAPAWMTINAANGALAGTPIVPGPISVQLRASNTSGTSAPVTVTINVAAAAGTPLVTSSRTASGQVGSTFTTYQITTSPAATSYSASGLPAGLVLNATTGAITGTPTVSGTYSVLVAGTNASGIGAPVVLTLTINPSATLVVP